MRYRTQLPSAFDVDVTTHGDLPGVAEYARHNIGRLGRFTHRPVLHARVRLTRHLDPAVELPVIAQGNLDVSGRLVRVQVEGATPREAVDRLEARLRRQLKRIAEHWDPQRGASPALALREWRHESEPNHRPAHFPRLVDERRIIRRKSFTLGTKTVDEATAEMELLGYDFHLFTEKRTGYAGVLYRGGATGYRLALVIPVQLDQLAPFDLPLTISAQRIPCLPVEQAAERLGLLGLPFMFFIEAAPACCITATTDTMA